tara:strand:- start:10015 stop:12819 length:2805 start_codon:yes stop_codon:yes gene_type:complete
MPKESLTLNGFAGGINTNKDLTDINSDGRGKDELYEANRFLLDQPGKVTTITPVMTGMDQTGLTIDSSDGTGNDNEENVIPNTILVKDNVLYNHQGVFSSGEDVNWSNNSEYQVNKPTQGTLYDSQSNVATRTDGHDLSIEISKVGDYTIFCGKESPFNPYDHGLIFTDPSSEGIDNKVCGDSTADNGKDARSLFAHFGDSAVDGNDGKFGYENDYWFENTNIAANNSGLGNPSDDDDFQTGTNLLSQYYYTNFPSWHAYKYQSGSTVDFDLSGADAEVDFTEFSDFGFHHNTSVSGDTRDTSALYFRVGKKEGDWDDSGWPYTHKWGFYGEYFDLSGDYGVSLDVNLQNGTGFDRIIVGLDSDSNDNQVHYQPDSGSTDSYVKQWTFTRAMIESAGGLGNYARITLASNLASFTGSNYNSARIKGVYVIPMWSGDKAMSGAIDPAGGSGQTRDGSQVLLRELTFELDREGSTSFQTYDWRFSQTKIKNGVESLRKVYADNWQGSSHALNLTFGLCNTVDYESKIYYEKLNKDGSAIGDPYLLAELNRDDGVKLAGDEEFTEWESDKVTLKIDSPPIYSNYWIESGYSDGVEHINARWKFSATCGSQTYIGNIQQPIDTNLAMSEWNNGKILKTVIGKPAGFADNMYIDLELGGDYITHMLSQGDRLFIFTRKKLVVINVAQETEFLEDEFKGYGVSGPGQVAEMDNGFAFINGQGPHIFTDRTGFEYIGQNLQSQTYWNPNSARVVWEPIRRNLFFFPFANPVLLYNVELKSWVYYSHDGLGSAYADGWPTSNGVIVSRYNATNNSRVPAMYCVYSSNYYGGFAKFNFLNYQGYKVISQTEFGTGKYRSLRTGVIDCGNIAQRKKFYKVYINIAEPMGYNGELGDDEQGGDWDHHIPEDNHDDLLGGDGIIGIPDDEVSGDFDDGITGDPIGE